MIIINIFSLNLLPNYALHNHWFNQINKTIEIEHIDLIINHKEYLIFASYSHPTDALPYYTKLFLSIHTPVFYVTPIATKWHSLLSFDFNEPSPNYSLLNTFSLFVLIPSIESLENFPVLKKSLEAFLIVSFLTIILYSSFSPFLISLVLCSLEQARRLWTPTHQSLILPLIMSWRNLSNLYGQSIIGLH